MKKFFIILSCVFFINSILDSENIELDIERLGENSVQISWSINYEEYDRIVPVSYTHLTLPTTPYV